MYKQQYQYLYTYNLRFTEIAINFNERTCNGDLVKKSIYIHEKIYKFFYSEKESILVEI